MLKIAIAETVYGIWMYRNAIVFSSNTNVDTKIVIRKIIETIVIRGWMRLKYRENIALLMM